MKGFISVLKVILLLVTAFFGLGFNVLGGIAMIMQYQNGGSEAIQISVGVGIAMIIITTLCFIGGTVLVMLKKSLIAAPLTILGMIGMLVLYGIYAGLTISSTNYESAAEIFMNNHLPSISITILTVIIAFMENYKKIGERREAKRQKDNRPSPSILGGNLSTEEQGKDGKK